MDHSEYTFNPNKLHYSKDSKNLKKRILKIISIVSLSLFLGIMVAILYSIFFDTPHERELRQENRSISQDLELLSQKYEMIDTTLKKLSRIDHNIYRTIFETDPVKEDSMIPSLNVYFAHLLSQDNELIITKTRDQLDRLLHDVYLKSPEFNNLLAHASRKDEMLKCMPAIQPINNKELTRLASGYGYRMHPFYNIHKFHNGIDFTTPTGTDVYATGDGVVEKLERTGRGHGNTVVIDHGFGYKTIYSHLDDFAVRWGQKVSRGDVIGWVGNTGLSVAPHLHYEVHLNEKPVNPVNYFFLELSPADYQRVIEISINSGQSFD